MKVVELDLSRPNRLPYINQSINKLLVPGKSTKYNENSRQA